MTDGFEPVNNANSTVDEVVDVFVVGFGCAGAAVALATAGNRVTILERASDSDGPTSAAFSTITHGTSAGACSVWPSRYCDWILAQSSSKPMRAKSW